MKEKARSSEAGGSDERTKDRILDAAEKLFAEHGYDGTSVRDINAIANVNSGAIHYYFRTKHELFREVVTRRGRILSDDRRARLDQCEEAEGGPPLLEQIVAAYILPYFNTALGSRQQRLQFARLRARMIADNSREADAMPLGQTHEDTGRRFVEALTRALPNLGPEEVRLRYLVMWSALNTLSAGLGFSALSGRAGSVPRDPIGQFATMTPQLVNLFSAMFRAPQLEASATEVKTKKAKPGPGGGKKIAKAASPKRLKASKG